MPEIRLTPSGQLRWESETATPETGSVARVRDTFGVDWRAGLFDLAAQKIDVSAWATVRYWQRIAERYLTGLCHIPEVETAVSVATPGEGEFGEWMLTAPPMRGGEYVSSETLTGIWTALDEWVHAAVVTAGGLGHFLSKAAPKWHQVGRVCFHLAENKNNENRPFAFMATYTTGFGASGQVKHQPLRQALEQYAGVKNRAALIRLLSPVQNAAERVAWVNTLVETGDIYRTMAWTAARAYQFLRSVADLEESGLSVRLPNWWQKRPRPRVAVSIGNQTVSTLGVDAMLDFDAQVALGDTALTREEVESLLDGPDGLVMIKGQWVEVDKEKLGEAIAHFENLRQNAFGGQISFIEGMRLLAGATQDLKAQDNFDETSPWAFVNAGKGLTEILAGLRDPSRLGAIKGDGGLRATLRPYQREGLAWLQFLDGLGLGACLADDMGLGKTLQVLALLHAHRRTRSSTAVAASLLIVPASLMGNWRQEAEQFAPDLNILFLHPSEMDKASLDRIAKTPETLLGNVDLVVTTYAMAARQSWLTDITWDRVILDEAQAIKNPGAQQTRAVKKFKARSRIVLTGTPIENRLGDLWSLFDFLNPGLLGSAKVFGDFVKTLQKRSENQFAPLRSLVAPYILRRLKTDRNVIADLPDKTEVLARCVLSKAQVQLYEQTVQAMKDALEHAEDTMARRGMVLQYLMRFKQICNHPSQLLGTGDYAPGDSGKFLRLAEICEEIAERQEKALVFTQFREIIDALEAHLSTVFGRGGLVLHGGTQVKKRAHIVKEFQSEDGPPFFILSLKAGGSGLNLTAASHVIHFDRWWNPAVENQATDRAFRIGQKKNVLVHKFVTLGTIEERIDLLIAEKRQLAEELLSDTGEVKLTELSDDELINLVRLDVTRATL